MTSNLSTTPVSSLATRLFGAALFSALFVVAWAAFVLSNPPKPVDFKPVPYSGYDIKPMRQAMSPDSVKAEFDAIMALGNRFPGHEGYDKVQDHIRKAFEDAKLEIHEQPIEFPAPTTLERRIVDAGGAPVDGVEIYPFLPNHFQPISTPREGVTGKRLGTHVWPGKSVLMFTVVTDEKKDELVAALKECQKTLFPGEGMKAFVLPAEEAF